MSATTNEMLFESGLRIVLSHEGGYANDPLDHGGPTNFGITQDTYNRFRTHIKAGLKDVKGITKDEVRQIYRLFYWMDGKCNKIAEVLPDLAIIHFDTAVNHGVGGAAHILQKSLGVEDDGIIGPKTLGAIEITPSALAIRLYLLQRELYYYRIVVQRPETGKFLTSWLSRLATFRKSYNIPKS